MDVIGRRSARASSSATWSLWALTLLLLSAAAMAPRATPAQSAAPEPTLPPSQRVTIDLAAGMPGQGPWLYLKDTDSPGGTAPTFATLTYNDSSWTQVGVPYSANLLTSFLNADSGGGDGDLNGTTNWYRLHFKLPAQYAGQKVQVEFEGAHTGVQVFINNVLLPGISQVTADASASHVVGFVPFIADLTGQVKTDGTDNVLAVRVSRNATWFEQPGFAENYRFGQADAGLFRPVRMFLSNPVHIPQNIYSNLATWGTYVATVSEVQASTGTATAASAVVEVQTNVLNEGSTAQPVTLTTQIVDATGKVVATAPPVTQTLAPMTPTTFPSGPAPMFDQQITVPNPTLWYPNNSTYGKPYMYKVYSIVSVNGAVVDAAQSPLGIRTITWDQNVPYFNGHPMSLWGGSGRYDYPGLGSSVPEEQQWRDLQQMAAMGGNLWRPGHSTSSEEFVNAADAFGIMIDQPSGEGEGAFSAACTAPPNTYCDSQQLKYELHRDMIIRDRSHPSILDWEANNGPMDTPFAQKLQALVNAWDPINPRAQADRTPNPANGLLLGCTLEGCEVGIKNQFPSNPAWGAEYWGTGTARGLAYDSELAFAAPFVDNWRKGRQANAWGMAQWYFADTPGEDSLFTEFQQYANTPQGKIDQSNVRSLGASMVDQNRFPKLLYYVYEAAWTPFSVKPVVHLAHHWNRAYQGTGPIQVNAFSNCPFVRLKINGVQQGNLQAPNPWTSDTSANLTQSTTLIPFQVSWPVTWQSGTVTAECLDDYQNVLATDSKTTAGAENHIVLSVVPELTKPDGTAFAVTANGSDAAFVVAQIVDSNGNLIPTAADNITFAVNGPATYMGGTEQYVSAGTDAYSTAHSELNYHAPGDPELQAEGGMTKVALRSQFTPGTVTVTATAPGLSNGTATYSIQPVASSSTPAPAAPVVIVPPQSLAVSAGQPATFSVTATGTAPLSFQWLQNGNPIAGATGSTYTVQSAGIALNGTNYSVIVRNSVNPSATSAAATLTVDADAAPAITTGPAAVTVSAGQTATFTVAATGSPTLTYQWYANNAPITGATGSSYTTPVLTTASNGTNYTVVVSNPVGKTAPSAAALLTVNAAVPPSIVTQPASQQVLANNPVTFTVMVAGSAPFTYQWQKNNVNIEGATAASFTIPSVQASDAGTYAVLVTNIAQTVGSAPATLALAPPGINLALGQPATASSYQDQVGMPASNAVDGNLTTRWTSAGGVDPSWIQVDLGTVQPFNEVVLNWEAAYAKVYQIQYQDANGAWQPAYTNNNGTGGTETLPFPTVKARYVRMYGTTRATAYGYSLFEFQVYDVAQCGASGERYTVLGPNSVLDNLSKLTWQRAETTYANTGAQYTQPIAQAACTSAGLRLPTQAEALAISGPAAASCAFPQAWNTWTSTPDPANSNDAAFVSSTGTSSYQVANNYPGAVLCTSGTSVAPPVITTQPAAATAAAGASATFTVAAGGTGPFTYQWYKNGTPITAAINPSYTTAPTATTDNGAKFSAVVTGPTGETATSGSAVLTISGTVPTGGGGGGGGTTNTDLVAIAAGNTTGTGTYSADTDFAGGGTASNFGAAVQVAGVPNAAPVAVYQSERAGTFTYTIPNLVAGTSYSGFLHFAETYFTKTGQRVFNVSLNGASFLPNFDIVQAAGGPNKAIAEPFTAIANASGQIVFSFTAGSADQPKVSGIEILAPAAAASSATVVAINAGGPATGNFVADGDFSGGGAAITNVTINTTGVLNAAPAVVYQSERAGVFTYTIPSLVPAANYNVRLHFAEFYWSQAGQRVFNVAINGTTVLPNFDIIKVAGAADLALVEPFVATANGNGQIVISFTAGSADQPKVSGIEILSSSGGAASPPTITSQPASVTVAPGQTATFTVTATGSGPLTYQWYKSGTAIASATAASYTTPAVAAADNNALFRVVVSSSAGSTVTSNSATLTVSASTGTCNAAPGAPAALTASAGSASQISLAWGASTVAAPCTATYKVFRSTVTGFAPSAATQIMAGVASTTFADTGLSPATAYYYLVEAVDSFAASAPSSQASATTLGSSAAPTISVAPSNQTVPIGTTASFSVTATGSGPLTYQWQKNGTAIPGATSATYLTPGTTAADNNASYGVVVSNGGAAAPLVSASLTVNSKPAYTVASGSLVTDLNNNTRGAWADNQVYIEIIGNNPANNALSWVNFDGSLHPAAVADNTGGNTVTGPDGKTYPNYAFTLAQTKQLKLPPLSSGRIFVSLGHPLYMSVVGGSPNLGYAGPNPLNNTDPNINTHYDWYEFTYGSGGLFINATQVDEFGLPLLLNVWGSVKGVSEAFFQQTGINESIAQIDAEFTAQTPATFHSTQVSPLRIFSPANSTFNTNEANANYFDGYVNSIWTQYASAPLTIQLNNGTRQFAGTTQGSQFVFTEQNLNNGAYIGGNYPIQKPTTQDILFCGGAFALGTYNGTQSAIGAQLCAAFNRGVMGNYANWTQPTTYYQQSPANFYAQFWHNHSVGGLAYGFAYDDVNNQSSTISTGTPEHMALGIGW